MPKTSHDPWENLLFAPKCQHPSATPSHHTQLPSSLTEFTARVKQLNWERHTEDPPLYRLTLLDHASFVSLFPGQFSRTQIDPRFETKARNKRTMQRTESRAPRGPSLWIGLVSDFCNPDHAQTLSLVPVKL